MTLSAAIALPEFLYQVGPEKFVSVKPPSPLSTWTRAADCGDGVYESLDKPMITEPHEFHMDPWSGFWEMVDD